VESYPLECLSTGLSVYWFLGRLRFDIGDDFHYGPSRDREYAGTGIVIGECRRQFEGLFIFICYPADR